MNKLLTTIFTLLTSISVLGQDVYVTELNYDTKRKDYDTFQFIDMEAAKVKNSPEAIIIGSSGLMNYVATITEMEYPTEETADAIQHSIKHELISQDYDMSNQNPDFYVTYGVFDGDGEIRANFRNDDENRVKALEVRKGTILISVIDAETSEAVWMGVSENALNGKYSVEEQVAIEKVTDILQQLTI